MCVTSANDATIFKHDQHTLALHEMQCHTHKKARGSQVQSRCRFVIIAKDSSGVGVGVNLIDELDGILLLELAAIANNFKLL